jgi:hypothetical protein
VQEAWLKEPLVRHSRGSDDLVVDERDVQTVMKALLDIKTDTKRILELLEEEDGQETKEDDS